MMPQNYGMFLGRRLDILSAVGSDEYGYSKPQTDTFLILHPKDETQGRDYPLYVVFHSAGHDVYSALMCTTQVGNHDVYHVPEDMYGLFLDCRANIGDWWWGGINAIGEGDGSRRGTTMQPVENRCIDTIKWTIANYPIDRNRVYGGGNSMGGSGVLGIGLNHGDIFAAIKANVPAGVRHAADRCCFDTERPEGFSIPEPPVTVDYSAQNDMWSGGHEILYNGMKDKRYMLFGYWGAFGHANNNEYIRSINDLFDQFDIFTLRLDEAYPAITSASTDDTIPWPDNTESTASGQVNAFIRWKVEEDSERRFAISLHIADESECNTRVQIPQTETCDVLIRRLQRFVPDFDTMCFIDGNKRAFGIDKNGHPFADRITVTRFPVLLEFKK